VSDHTPGPFGFAYRAPLRVRVRLAWGLLRGDPTAYRIGVHGTGIYLPELGSVVGCEVRPSGFAKAEGFVIEDNVIDDNSHWGIRHESFGERHYYGDDGGEP
jgi:hypothetical protein